MIEDEAMSQNIEQVSHPRDAISKELHDKCMDRLTGADKWAEQLDGLIANTISIRRQHSFDSVMNEIGSSFDNFEPALLNIEPFTMQPFEWPRYLDRSCMVKLDNINVP